MEKKVHLLFIDDEPSILELVQVYLQNIRNLEITCLTTLTEAHHYIQNNAGAINVVVCDIGLDEGEDFKDGMALLRHLRKSGVELRWSFCSGHTHLKEDIMCDKELCVTSFLEKPFTKKELLSFIINMIQ